MLLICCVGVVGWGEEVSEGWGFNYGEVGVYWWGWGLLFEVGKRRVLNYGCR